MRVAKEAIHISHISGCDRPIHTSLRAETIVDRIKKRKKNKIKGRGKPAGDCSLERCRLLFRFSTFFLGRRGGGFARSKKKETSFIGYVKGPLYKTLGLQSFHGALSVTKKRL